MRSWDKLILLLMLKDRYRPNAKMSRSAVIDLGLEAKCELSLISKEFEEEYCGLTREDAYEDIILPVRIYWKLLENHPDWQEKIEKAVEKKGGVSEGADRELKWYRDFLKFGLREIGAGGIINESVYSAFVSAYLTLNYRVAFQFTPARMEIRLLSGEGKCEKEYGEYFPAFLFLPEVQEDETYLTSEEIGIRMACNESHRLSRFMLEHAKQLNKTVPGVFRKMIRILMTYPGANLIRAMNAQLTALRKLPGNPFGVSERLYLTEADFYSCSGEDSTE